MILFFIIATIVVVAIAARLSDSERCSSSDTLNNRDVENIARIEKARFLSDCIKSIKGG
jgi:hypothetical protein